MNRLLIGKDMFKKNKKEIQERIKMNSNLIVNWVMVDDRHPIFNVWKAFIKNGNSYIESFVKGVDPNETKHYGNFGEQLKKTENRKTYSPTASSTSAFKLNNVDFRSNPYKYMIKEREISIDEICEELDLDRASFYVRLDGFNYFTKKQLTKLNELLGYENKGYIDIRILVNPDLWCQKYSGAYEESAEYLRKEKSDNA